jgi:hypothetical protein
MECWTGVFDQSSVKALLAVLTVLFLSVSTLSPPLSLEQSPGMEVVGFTASIATLIQLTKGFIEYLRDLKVGSEDRQQLTSELQIVLGLYHQMNNRVEEGILELADNATQQLRGGPLQQMRKVSNDIVKKLGVNIDRPALGLGQPRGKPLSKLEKAIWPFPSERDPGIHGDSRTTKDIHQFSSNAGDRVG